jgi:hypothetical protein
MVAVVAVQVVLLAHKQLLLEPHTPSPSVRVVLVQQTVELEPLVEHQLLLPLVLLVVMVVCKPMVLLEVLEQHILVVLAVLNPQQVAQVQPTASRVFPLLEVAEVGVVVRVAMVVQEEREVVALVVMQPQLQLQLV